MASAASSSKAVEPAGAPRGYRPIGDYALIGDTRTSALVARDGSIDWCCLPDVDSPAVFCRILDAAQGGFFRVGPTERYRVTRTYLDDTNVLATTFTADRGTVRVTDLMAVEPREGHPQGVSATPTHDILRLVEGLSGHVQMEVAFRPTFNYARAQTTVTPRPDGAVASAGGELLVLGAPVELRPDSSGGVSGRLGIAAGDRVWVTLAHHQGGGATPAPISAAEADAALQRTLSFWRGWSARCTYEGPYHPLVRRSALALKLLTYAPTGAIVAAPTTSLPEEIGGVRNWDYRFTWLRDAGLILYALQSIGYHGEAADFFEWLERISLRCRHGLQIMYRVNGDEDLPEQVLEHLEGYRGSRPVRTGNAAAGQLQLDVYGEVLDAASLHFTRSERPMDVAEWELFRDLADRAARRWREPDQGIWEVRGGPRQFLYSKLLCWVAVDRALKLAQTRRLEGDLEGWRRARTEIRQVIESQGYNPEVGAFTQVLGDRTLDASALVIPLVGFLPATDPRVRSTVEQVRSQLTHGGLVYRYHPDQAADGVAGREATFALCSFWLVDALALDGRVAEARALFERVIGYANDVGLLAEEIDPGTRALLGNFPQGFTHLGLIRAAISIARAEQMGPETTALGMAERQRRPLQARDARGRTAGMSS